MYSLVDIKLPSTKRLVMNTNPLTVDLGGISANDASTLCLIFVVSSISAGINAINYASIAITQSWDDGATWMPIPALDIRETAGGTAVLGITGMGSFTAALTASSGMVSPSLRVTITPPAGEWILFSYIRKTNVGPGGIVIPRSAIVGSGVGPGPSPSAPRVAAVLVNSIGDVDTMAIAAAQKSVSTVAITYCTLSLGMGWNGTAHKEILLNPANDYQYVENGTDTLAITKAQQTKDTLAKTNTGMNIALGWDTVNSTHKELAVDGDGHLLVSGADQKPEYSSAYAPVTRDFSSSGLTATVWSELIASTSAKSVRLNYANTCGEVLEIGFGAGGAEASKYIMASAGDVEILIPASTRVSLRCDSNVAIGKLYWSALA